MGLQMTDIQYIAENPQKVFNVLDGMYKFLFNAASIAVSPAALNVPVAEAIAGKVIPIKLQLRAASTDIPVGDFTLAASVGDTIASGAITPTISDTTPDLVDGTATITLTLPANANYLATETITVTIANYTAPDGRTVTGGTCVVTLTA